MLLWLASCCLRALWAPILQGKAAAFAFHHGPAGFIPCVKPFAILPAVFSSGAAKSAVLESSIQGTLLSFFRVPLNLYVLAFLTGSNFITYPLLLVGIGFVMVGSAAIYWFLNRDIAKSLHHYADDKPEDVEAEKQGLLEASNDT